VPTPSAASSVPLPPADLGWDVPSKWKAGASASSMRKATYVVPKSAGDAEDGEMSVTQVGGSVDANIDRWVGQFGGAKESLKRTEQKVGTLKVTIVELSGKYTGGGMPGAPPTPKDDWALLAAIVEPLDPPYFFKLTGPKKTLKEARPDFDRLVKSLRAK
jgi:hypothetical protein